MGRGSHQARARALLTMVGLDAGSFRAALSRSFPAGSASRRPVVAGSARCDPRDFARRTVGALDP